MERWSLGKVPTVSALPFNQINPVHMNPVHARQRIVKAWSAWGCTKPELIMTYGGLQYIELC
jgi:hypothetical protein